MIDWISPASGMLLGLLFVIVTVLLNIDTGRKVKVMKQVAADFEEFYKRVDYAKLREELLIGKLVQRLGLDPVEVSRIVDELREEVKREIAKDSL